MGQSYWSAVGRADAILNVFLREAGYTSVNVDIQRGTPHAAWVCKMFENGTTDQLLPSHRTQKTLAIRKKDMDGVDRELKNEWDWLVFHGLSNDAKAENAIEIFDLMVEFIRNRDSETPLFIEMTWPKDESDFELYKTLHRHLAARYEIPFIPTGVAFEQVLNERPDIRLYRTPSDYHPSIYGQYLQSCMVFSAVTGKSPVGMPSVIEGAIDGKTGEPVDLEPEVAEYIQTIVWDTWLAERELAKNSDYGKME